MDWNKETVQKMEWNGEISNYEEKLRIAKKIVDKVKDGDVIGVGSGSTSFVATKEIAKKIKEENLHITAIPTSYEINLLCNELGIPTASLMDRGAAMYREKLNVVSSEVTYILVDESKFVKNICDKFPIPVEVTPKAINYVRQAMFDMGAESITLRPAKGKDGPVITEEGNVILEM